MSPLEQSRIITPGPLCPLPPLTLTVTTHPSFPPRPLCSHSYRWDAGQVREVLERKRAAGRLPVNVAAEKARLKLLLDEAVGSGQDQEVRGGRGENVAGPFGIRAWVHRELFDAKVFPFFYCPPCNF